MVPQPQGTAGEAHHLLVGVVEELRHLEPGLAEEEVELGYLALGLAEVVEELRHLALVLAAEGGELVVPCWLGAEGDEEGVLYSLAEAAAAAGRLR